MINDDSWGLERSSPVPLYYQLACRLRDRIRSGSLAPGKRLPTEHELARQTGLSRLTARQCYTLLEKDGVISRFRSKGTYVADAQGREPLTARKNVLFVTFLQNSDVYFARVLKGVEKGFNTVGGCNLLLRLAPENEADTIREAIKSRPDGILWIWRDHDLAEGLIGEMLAANVPLVAIDNRLDRMKADCVSIDLEWGVGRMVDLLAGQGCRRIRFLNVGHNSCRMIMRSHERAFKLAVAGAGLSQGANTVEHLELSMDESRGINAILDKVALRKAQYDALVIRTIFADPLDYARYLWTHHADAMKGKKVGFMLSDAHPAESTAGLPLAPVLRSDFEMGRQAAELMLKRLRSQGPRESQTILLRS